MNPTSAWYLAQSISLFSLCVAASILEVFDKPNDLMWLGVFIWIVFGFWGGYTKINDDSKTCKTDEEFVREIVREEASKNRKEGP